MSDKDDKKGRDRSRGDRDDKGDRDRRPPPERTGHVAPADPALVEFLERLWTRENPPTRLEVWRVVGSNRDVRSAMVFYENFKPDDVLDIERCTRLAGEILSAAQNDCDCAEKRSLYEIAVLDSYQKTQPLLRRLGPLMPQRTYAGTRPDGEPKGLDDDDDGAIGIKPITHKYLSKMVRSMERTMNQVHAMMGDFMQMQQMSLMSRDSHVERLQNANMALFAQMQDAADRSLDREVIREKEKMKIKAIGSGLGIAKHVAIGWFGPIDEETSDRKALPPGSKSHGASRERALIASFLEECEQEKVSIDLFGDWQSKEEMTVPEVSAGLGLIKPGVFTPAQFGILLGVSSGQLPPDALDALMPGGLQQITPEQMMLAQPMLTQSMWMALQQVKEIRDEKRDAQAQKGQANQGEAK